MEIRSENIKKYLINNIQVSNDNIEMEDLLKLKEININWFNSKLEKAYFNPNELSYLKEIISCSFNNFVINDEILENINKLNKLEVLNYDFCKSIANKSINNKIKEIYMNCSDIELLLCCNTIETMEKIFLKNIENVDINTIEKFKNVKEIYLLNCKVKNIVLLEKFKNLSYVEIIGSKIDNYETIEKLKKKIRVKYSKEEYFYTE